MPPDLQPLLRVSVRVPADEAEEARITMLTLFPEGFEEIEVGNRLELAAYTDEGGARRARAAFGAVSVTPVVDGWEEAWRRFHRPVRVGPIWIGPPWEDPPAEGPAVQVDPGRAFGTGAHETTRLCIQFVLELEGGSLLDVGCGSGVISIAAAKLGFEPVHAIDRDPTAVEAARENVRRNDVLVDVLEGDALETSLPEADVAVANIEAHVIAALAPHLLCRYLVGSGYYRSEVVEPPGFRRLDRREEHRWAADLFVRHR